jgi:hypothetical protein
MKMEPPANSLLAVLTLSAIPATRWRAIALRTARSSSLDIYVVEILLGLLVLLIGFFQECFDLV